jgi:hypothetical protein
VASKASSTVELTKESDGSYTFHTNSTFRNQKLNFRIGVEFVEERMDGESVPCVVTFQGNKMLQIQMGQKPVKIMREFRETEMIVTCSVSNTEATRWFRAIE